MTCKRCTSFIATILKLFGPTSTDSESNDVSPNDNITNWAIVYVKTHTVGWLIG